MSAAIGSRNTAPRRTIFRRLPIFGVLIRASISQLWMALLKIARIQSGTATEDSFVDLAGYAACGGEIATDNH